MRSGIAQLARNVFGSVNDRRLKSGQEIVNRVNALEDGFASAR